MFKSSAYLFMLTAVGAFVVLAAMAIPQVFTADMGEDLRDDLSRAREMALDQYRLRSWEQVTAAQTAASPELADAVNPKPPEPEPEPEPVRRFPRRLPPEPEPEPQAPEPDKGAIQKLAANIARSLRQDLVLVLDEEGKVLGSNNEESPAAEGDDLSGLPAVQEALKGFSRDGIWIIKPGEVVFTLGVSPLTAVRDGKQTLVGAVLLGKQLDGSFTAQVAQQLNPTDHHNYTIG
ncbi:MAG: hypothetical protein AAFS10_20090, partial [Myxococcota bacterium]